VLEGLVDDDAPIDNEEHPPRRTVPHGLRVDRDIENRGLPKPCRDVEQLRPGPSRDDVLGEIALPGKRSYSVHRVEEVDEPGRHGAVPSRALFR
jgi:hypothetical protein